MTSTFTVLLFGPYRDALGTPRVMVKIEHTSAVTPPALFAALRTQAPALAPLLPAARLAKNGEFAAETEPLTSSDELALIGLVSGG